MSNKYAKYEDRGLTGLANLGNTCYINSTMQVLSHCYDFNELLEKIDIENLKTNISNKKIGQSVNGHTNTVFINPLNSLKFVLNKIRKNKINLDKDFYVFTGSTVGVVPIQGKGTYLGKIDKLGSVKAAII